MIIYLKQVVCSLSFVSGLLLSLPLTHSTEDVNEYLKRYQLEPAIEASSKAPFLCHNGGRLVRGQADYSMFPPGDDGMPFSFLQESSRHGFHCICPEGFTGLKCGRPYEFCDKTVDSISRNAGSNSSVGHVCFNNGKCIDGLEAIHSPDQQYCDCSNATLRGQTHSGKYCEKTAPNIKTCNRQGSQFCVHGTCNEETATLEDLSNHMPCICDEGYAGEHCNFLESEQPACDLDCGVGTCRVTYAHYDEEGMNDTGSYWQHNINHTFCTCPPGHTGAKCEISAEDLASGSGSVDTCDDSMRFWCMNGGVCLPNYLLSPDRPCSCPVGFDGPHCEFQEGTYSETDCTLECKNGGVCVIGIQSLEDATNYTQSEEHNVNNMYCQCEEGKHGRHCEVDLSDMHTSQCGEPPNEVFCFNGVCDVDRASNQPICHCKRGWVGEACQYKEDAVPECSLECGQQGTCVLGIKALADSNDINRFWETHVNFTYCRCNPGWFGTNCELPSLKCGSKTCLGNGTKCAATEGGESYCDCSSVTESNDPLALAGEHCQYEATSFCETPTESYFCYNDGTCSSTSAGCDCKEGFSGPVCEYEKHREPKCSLKCEHGVCKKGNKYISNVTKNPELSFLQAFSNANFAPEHCLCEHGYTGKLCETKVEVCGDDSHICLHGSECLEEDDGSFRCDCEKAFTPESRYAGKYCQHHHTDVCSPPEESMFGGSATEMFCVNDGVCLQPSAPGFPGCDCGPLYFGRRCEFSRVYDDVRIADETTKKSYPWFGTAIYIFFLSMVVTMFALIGLRIRQKRREMDELIEESKRWAEESLSPFTPTAYSDDDDVTEGSSTPPLAKTPRSRLDSVEIL